MSIVSRVLLGGFASASSVGALSRAMKVVSPETWKARLAAVLTVDETQSLCRIQLPVLYLRASKDRVVFPGASAVISGHVPGIKVVEIDAPHFLLQARPRESAAAIKAFAHDHGLAL